MRVLDLFSGIGGFSLGLEMAGDTGTALMTGDFETVAFCEKDPFCRKVLAMHWPNVPVYKYAETLTGTALKAGGLSNVDLICGGFPCQPFSTAARGRNPPDTMSFHFIRIIEEMRPKYVLAENTEKKAFSEDFIRRLRNCGYEIEIMRIGAHEIGGDHIRNRWWLCAYPDNESELSRRLHAEMALLPKVQDGVWASENYARMLRVPYGLPNRVDRLKSLGNAVVPQVVEQIGRAIMAAEA